MKQTNTIFFFKGNFNVTEQENEGDNALEKIRKSFEKVLDGKNLSFLLGSGCSSFIVEGSQAIIDSGTENITVLEEEDVKPPASNPLQLSEDSDFESLNLDFAKIEDETDPSTLQDEVTKGLNEENEIDSIENNIREAGVENLKEVGIPTMKPLAAKFFREVLSAEEKNQLLEELGIDTSSAKFNSNLESFLGTLHSIEFFEDSIGSQMDSQSSELTANGVPIEENQVQEIDRLGLIRSIVKKVKDFLIDEILNEQNKNNGVDEPLNNLYERFYRKLLYRNSNLPKPNIFTTNYDLYSETAMDKLGIHYVNGFSGGIKKYFNPTIFNYAMAEKMDLSQNKWGVIDNFFYLYKIHGSINWIQDRDGSKLFNVREIQETTGSHLKSQETVMIHPTPLKFNASLGSPYSDLFREFQRKLMQNNNVLVTIGYSFSDEHINNLIYQAFTIPSFRLIVLGDPAPGTEIEKLKLLNDPRIWIIGGVLRNGNRLHYFQGFVDHILPDLTNDEIDDKIENAIRVLFKKNEQGR